MDPWIHGSTDPWIAPSSYRVMFLRLFHGLLLRAFLAGHPPKKLSKVGVLDEGSTKKSKNITPESHLSHQAL